VPLAALTFAGFGAVPGRADCPEAVAKAKPATVRGKTDLGNVLVNSKGRTLYHFLADEGTTSACSGACATNWPPLRASGTPKAGKGTQASLLTTSPRSDGKAQVVYNGHPLYTFQGDKKAGATTGQGVNAFGAQWFAVSGTGEVVMSQPSTRSGADVHCWDSSLSSGTRATREPPPLPRIWSEPSGSWAVTVVPARRDCRRDHTAQCLGAVPQSDSPEPRAGSAPPTPSS
jgi:predicted lipoprotein with Yx(FWY)xxD motif